MEKWWIPINWACHHVKKEQISGGHLPKEGKEVASALIKFNQNLELVAEYKYNPLPALASQAVHFVFWGSMFFAAFCIEPTNFDVIGWRGFLLVSNTHKCFTYVTQTRANLTTYSRKPENYNGTNIFEIDIMKILSPINLNLCQT